MKTAATRVLLTKIMCILRMLAVFAILLAVHADERNDRYQWEVTWEPCSVTCSTGYQRTSSTCKDVISGLYVDKNHCAEPSRPNDVTLQCTLPVCESKQHYPNWYIGSWSPCSTTCGYGYQQREVICTSLFDPDCSVDSKPPVKQPCRADVSCNGTNNNQDFTPEYVEPSSVKPRKSSLTLDGTPVEPRYVTDDWSLCSITCGLGVRTRRVLCKAYFFPTGLQWTLPDKECSGSKPAEKEDCVVEECDDPLDTSRNEIYGTGENFKWIIGQFSQCSRSCLGGQQRTRLECVRELTGTIVSPSYCSNALKPVSNTRVCNDIPCPPRWQVGDYGPCTSDCGGGLQRRRVQCVRDIRSGTIEFLEGYRCPDPIPISERSCNTQFCPAKWMTSGWSECSGTCGPGVQTRRAFCVKSPVRGHQVTVSDTECLGPKPMTSRRCHHLNDCFASPQAAPFIKAENYTFIQFKRSKKVKLNVGGRLILLPGQSLTIRCLVKNFHRKLIFWSKGFKLIPMAGRVRTTFSGNLKIQKANPSSDAGTYTCMAGSESADVTINFHTKLEAKRKAKEMRNHITNNNNIIIGVPPPYSNGSVLSESGVVSDPQYNISKQFVFTTGTWSACSVTCGSGNRRRNVTCVKVTDKYVKILGDRECIKLGLAKPQFVEKCSIGFDCPVWKIGEWNKCSRTHCVRDGLGQQKRYLDCVYTNGTIARLEACNHEERPPHKQECENHQCISLWKTTKWTKCRPLCAKTGYKTRMLTCIWKKTRLPAWSTCKTKPRPSLKKACRPRYCGDRCVDQSRYCSIVAMLKMCRLREFRTRCCSTCKRLAAQGS